MELDLLQIYELYHDKLEKYERCEVKVKYLALMSKYDSDKKEESQSEDDALIKKFEKLLRMEKTKKKSQREMLTSRKKVTCFDCGRRDHVKSECHTLQKNTKVINEKDMK